ncbi:MAG: BON domain-containing protein [Gemmataceae bacterium]|nr:BON domain-containing protein [Gemmataceae bacterium]
MRLRQSFLIGVMLLAGCKQQDVDGLGRIGRKLLERTQAAASPLRERFDSTLSGMSGRESVRQRVRLRMQWDQALAKEQIEVHATGGVVELRGTVKTDQLRRRAVELAEATVGVERVADQLQIE